jgi:hypothetical protein
MGLVSKGGYCDGNQTCARGKVDHEKVNHSEDMENISDVHKCTPQVNWTIFSSFLQIE